MRVWDSGHECVVVYTSRARSVTNSILKSQTLYMSQKLSILSESRTCILDEYVIICTPRATRTVAACCSVLLCVAAQMSAQIALWYTHHELHESRTLHVSHKLSILSESRTLHMGWVCCGVHVVSYRSYELYHWASVRTYHNWNKYLCVRWWCVWVFVCVWTCLWTRVVCVCVRVCVDVCVCVCACEVFGKHVYLYMCVHVSLRVSIYARFAAIVGVMWLIHVCDTCAHAHTHTHDNVHIHTYEYICIWTRMHMYIYTYTYIYI